MTSRSGTTLQRGRACNTCRKRKIRCDAIRPICTQCIRSARPGEPCEYNEVGKTRAQILEETVAKLQAQVRDLELPADDTSIKLVDPYFSSPGHSVCHSEHSYESNSDYESSGSSRADGPHNEPQLEVKHSLLTSFLADSFSCGFFLDIQHFGLRAHSPDGDPSLKPFPALMDAIYVWSVRLSNDPSLKMYEKMFLSRAVKHLATAFTQPGSPYEVIEIIQTHILLTTYYMDMDQDLQANSYLTAAVSLTLSSNLHSLSKEWFANNLHDESSSVPQLAPFQKEEMIRAFWTVFILNNSTASQETATGMTFDLDHGVQVGTVWPRDNDVQYEERGYHASLVLQNFWHDVSLDSAEEYSQFAILAKASFLYRQAHNLTRRARRGQVSNNLFVAEFSQLDRLLVRFRERLTPTEQFYLITPHSVKVVLASHSLAYAAQIELHTPTIDTDPCSLDKWLDGSDALYSLLCGVDLQAMGSVFAIQGDLWVKMCEVQIQELGRFRLSQNLWTKEEIQRKETKVMVLLKEALSAIALQTSPRFKRQLKEVQDFITCNFEPIYSSLL